jgi:transposase-like protein
MRRAFSADYKLAILAEYDRCTEKGEKGALLRREGLYSSLACDWRRQHRQGLLKAALGQTVG